MESNIARHQYAVSMANLKTAEIKIAVVNDLRSYEQALAYMMLKYNFNIRALVGKTATEIADVAFARGYLITACRID